ncbi:MAG: DUF4292 domain-containing protein [Flavobacteriales bacterium]|jgi:hypothetical protein|nr:DUF4292 domain-containing protein [Flavobacteriales bacterium]
MKHLFSLLFVLVLLSACGGAKYTTGSNTAKPSMTVKDLTKAHANASPNFTTMAARVQVVYENENKLQSITASLRMEKDKKIWIKASILGITLAKVLITPDKVSYYETIGNTYFEGDFTLLSEWLGTEINFNKAQAILLGQSIFPFDAATYSATVANNKYKVQPKVQPQNFIHSIFLNPENFKVASESLSQPYDDRLLSIRYASYQTLEAGSFPSEIDIDATEAGSKTKIQLNYKDIDLNVSIGFPFTIPEGYTAIEL